MKRVKWRPTPLIDPKTGNSRGSSYSSPRIFIVVSYNGKRFRTDGLVDSGAFGLLMPKYVADNLGIHLSTLRTEASYSASGNFTRYVLDNGLTLTVYGDEYEVEASFTDSNDFPFIPLLGMTAIFHKYKVIIDSASKSIYLDPYE